MFDMRWPWVKFTGPRTAEGKAASRGNSFRHGLTGEGVVLTDEDAAAVEERFAAFEADLKPANGVASAITRRAAILSVRMERCARQEAANLNERMLAAPGIEADERAAELAAHIEAVRTEPERRVRHLRLSPEGIDRMIAEWLELRAVLIDRDPLSWAGGYVSRMTDLLGTSAPRSWYCPTPEDRTAMAEVIDGCVAGLRAERSALDLEGVARSRAAAASRAIFDPSKGGELAWRCEAAAERGFYRASREVERIDESARDAGAETTSDAVGSYGPGPEPEAERVPSPPRPRHPARAETAISGPKPIGVVPQGGRITADPPIRE